MNGMVFEMLADVVSEELSPQTWDAVLIEAGIEGAYTGLGEYPDADLFTLVDAAAKLTGTPPQDLLRWAGRHGFKQLSRHVPHVLAAVPTWHELLLQLDDTVHVEVAKLIDHRHMATFAAQRLGPEELAMDYVGGRQLCGLGEGLILGAGDWYTTDLVVDQVRCTRRGDDRCTFLVAVAP